MKTKLNKAKWVINRILWNSIKKKLNNTVTIWNYRYVLLSFHHTKQNVLIATDFLMNAKEHLSFKYLLSHSRSMIEIGCGTGEFCQLIAKEYSNHEKIIGTEISSSAVKYCIKNNKHREVVDYVLFNSFKHNDGLKSIGKFDYALCSNVLEHFKNPFVLLDQMLNVAEHIIVIVPYKHISTNLNELEDGGIEHLFKFDENSFNNYNVIEYFTFKSKGWENVKDHSNPLQLAILLKS